MVSRGRRVQDDNREAALARMLELQRSDSRMGPDATDEYGNEFELKTTTKRSLSTGRDVGIDYLQRMRTQYLIAARGHQTNYAFTFEEIYFLHPCDLEGWIQPHEARLQRDLDIVERAHGALSAVGACVNTLKRLLYIGRRGITLNNPKIPWQYISENGTLLGPNPSLDLREQVVSRPLPASDADSSTDVAEC